jgi:N-acetylmuramic acid 6-phosphate etherase
MHNKPTTEQESRYQELENMALTDLLENINKEDNHVPLVIKGIIPDIEKLVNAVVAQLQEGGRLFYIGAGN